MILKLYQTKNIYKCMYGQLYYVSLRVLVFVSTKRRSPNNDCFQQSLHYLYNIIISAPIYGITRELHTTKPTRSNDDLRPVYIRQFVTIARGPNLAGELGISPNSSGSIKGQNTHDKRVLQANRYYCVNLPTDDLWLRYLAQYYYKQIAP